MIKTHEQAHQDQVEGIAASAAGAGKEWIEYAIEYVMMYLMENETLFCDDVWESGLLAPSDGDRRAFGQVMKHAIREGWMTATGTTRRSKQSNNSPRNVYKSLVVVR